MTKVPTVELDLKIVTLSADLRDWANRYIAENWGATLLVSCGQTYQAENLSGFVAVEDEQPRGLLTYRIDDKECEVVTINSSIRGKGVGTALLNVVEAKARSLGCSRIWLITTNDNTDAMRFYQMRGFDLRKIHLNAIEESRRLKPSIPLIGNHGIAIKHEIEFELILSSSG